MLIKDNYPCLFWIVLFCSLFFVDLYLIDPLNTILEGTDIRSTSFSRRTHMCGQLTSSDLSQHVVVCGWLQHQRMSGQFLVLRDAFGTVQVVLTSNEVIFCTQFIINSSNFIGIYFDSSIIQSIDLTRLFRVVNLSQKAVVLK